ncbi:hypothetical protein A3A60_03715 [Candidatus Curtissbacteria bacterium RIFCSPLOWO2_01_FULL_42_26]|uniref:Uncharacterized protein n=1 Tax=Candidatus Curtissbacteria bacterium RIFCSPLOWO2_01_FULL_42_26 TaxID=1797729 RepID=A0A1F5HW22_9BACT|nr:MAG: hypothetical protein A3A60_03715 [Candidatus Curtissbacteria bacterium RIFCSPLOWO2_01_FULL_42_26]
MAEEQIQQGQAPNQNQTLTAPVQASDNLDTLMGNAQNVNKVLVWGYLIWGLALPPITTILALVLALRRGVFFTVLPAITIAFSLLAIISPVVVYFLFGPIHIVTTQFTLSQNIYADTGLALTSMFLTLLAIAGIVLGIYFRRRAKQTLALRTIPTVVLIVILALEHLILFMNISSAARVISKQAQILLNQQGIPY